MFCPMKTIIIRQLKVANTATQRKRDSKDLIAEYKVYGNEFTNSQSLALLVGSLLGEEARRWFALGAYIIAFSNVGTYILGFARMVQSMASQRAIPQYFNILSNKGTPVRAVSLVGLACLLSLLLVEFFGTQME